MERAAREQKLEALQEKKRRLKGRRPPYKPHEGQLALHKDEKPIRFCAAGNGFGKSTAAVEEAYWACTGYNPILDIYTKVPAKVVVLLDSPAKVAEIWLPALEKWFNLWDEFSYDKQGKPFISRLTHKRTNSVIQFYFHEQSEMAFEGVELDMLIADEPFPRHVWIGLTRGMRRKGAQPRVLIIGTPIGQPWMYRELWKPAEDGERDDIGIHTGDSELNKANLADEALERFAKNLTEKEKEIRLHGKFGAMEGLALGHLFSPSTHVVPAFSWPNNWPVVVAVDFHQAKPHHACMVGINREGYYFYLKEFKSKAPPSEYALELKEFYKGYKVKEIICDSLGNTPLTGGLGNSSFIQRMNSLGIPMRATSYKDKSEEEFMHRIVQVLEIPKEKDNFGTQTPKLRIIEGNTGIINDIQYVQWEKYKNSEDFKPRLDISNKDWLACLKYALSVGLENVARPPRTIPPKRPSPWGWGRKNK